MNTKNKLVSGATAVASVLAFMAGPSAHAGPSVPLTGGFSYTSTLDAAKDPACPLAGMMVGIGNLSHLGKSAVVATDCITQAYGSFVILHGSITVTAANGDKLTATYTGSFIPAGGTLLQTRDVTYSITGGTGRFEGARGAGRLEGSEDMATHQGALSVVGTISY
ncbi:hypothetical protein ABC383_16395 [Noviherbaspirillum sp. 1P10PC]|uniref:hypothetical protein n=1 Tax=Noviherbaspirillum sp. 1P10PC TaxID=3132292 RepID=UPI00399FD6FD